MTKEKTITIPGIDSPVSIFKIFSIEQADSKKVRILLRNIPSEEEPWCSEEYFIPAKAEDVFALVLKEFGGITKRWRVYGENGHRQRESFEPSIWYNFSEPGKIRLIEVLNSDITGTNDYTEIAITCNTTDLCNAEMEGQICDGIFENCRVGKVVEVID